MNVVSIIMAAFALLGALDRIFGSKLGLGREFEKGFLLLGQITLSMLGMIVISPVIADLLAPFFDFVYNSFGVEPSIIPASLFANDMGGAPLARDIAKNSQIGMFNATVVSALMGATVSFTIPLSLGCVKKEKHRELLVGLLCGIVTIPVGCLIAGIFCGIPFIPLILNLLPLIVFAAIIALGLLFARNLCIKIFSAIGALIKALITVGLVLGISEMLIGYKPFEAAAGVSEATMICINAAMAMAGAFPLLFILSKVLSKPMELLGKAMKIEKTSTLGFIASLATNVTTFGMMNEMDKKGTVLNSAFAVSGAFLLGGHLAFTLAFDASYLAPVMIAKITAGIAAVAFALLIHKRAA